MLVEICNLPPAGRVPCGTPVNALPIAGDGGLCAEFNVRVADAIVELANVDIEYLFACSNFSVKDKESVVVLFSMS